MGLRVMYEAECWPVWLSGMSVAQGGWDSEVGMAEQATVSNNFGEIFPNSLKRGHLHEVATFYWKDMYLEAV